MTAAWRTAGDRYEREVAARADQLLRDGEDRADVQPTRLPANMAQPGPVHLAVMGAVEQVLTMGLSHPNAVNVPHGLRGLVRVMRRLQPLMLEELAKVPEQECLVMMRTLAAGITQLADSVDPARSGLAVVAAQPRPAESPTA